MEMAVRCIQFVDAYRKKGQLLFKADPNSLTDGETFATRTLDNCGYYLGNCFAVECTAEQVYHESMIAYALLTVGVDQTVMGFIKGAIRMRSGFNGIKYCERILKERKRWESEILRREFECGIVGCLGVFDMVIIS